MSRCLIVIIILPLLAVNALGRQDDFKKLENAVVWVKALDGNDGLLEQGSGTIIEIKANRVLVLTVYHVVDSVAMTHIDIGTERGKIATAQIFRYNAGLDFAVLESLPNQAISGNLCYLALKKKSRYKPTDLIIVAGFPKEFDNLSYHKGNLQNIEGSFVRYYLEDDKLAKGESGSPLLDKDFHLIGLNHGYVSGAVNLAIRGDLIGNILDQWGIQYTEPRNPWPTMGGVVTAVGLSASSWIFHRNSKEDLKRYQSAVTVDDLRRYWDATEANRKRGNITAILSYSAAVFTGYQLWRNHYLPIKKTSLCQVEFYPTVTSNRYAAREAISYGIAITLAF